MPRVRFPALTVIAVAVATVAAVVQYAVPSAVPLLQRDPGGLPAGQWWRLVTPLLVQTLGWYQVLANLVTLALFGVLAEWLLTRWQWVLLFAAGTAGGQGAAYAWHEPGGGDSIAICGLAAGVVVALLFDRGRLPKVPVYAAVYYVAALTGWGLHGPVGAGLVCVAAALWLFVAPRGWLIGPHAERLALAGTVVAAIVLALDHDLHGAALSAATLVAVGVAAFRSVTVTATATGSPTVPAAGSRRPAPPSP
jgi:hypothetical protein